MKIILFTIKLTCTKTRTDQTLVNLPKYSAKDDLLQNGLRYDGTHDLPKHVADLLTPDVYIFWSV